MGPKLVPSAATTFGSDETITAYRMGSPLSSSITLVDSGSELPDDKDRPSAPVAPCETSMNTTATVVRDSQHYYEMVCIQVSPS